MERQTRDSAARAMALHRQGKAREAWPLYRAALQGGAGDPQLLAMAGIAAAAVGETAEAVGLLERAAEAVPDNAELRYNLAAARAKAGQSEAALSDFARLETLTPKSPEGALGQAKILIGAARWDAAAEALARARALRPRDPQILLLCGIVAEAQGRLAEAEESLRLACRLAPDLPEPALRLAGVIEKTQSPAAAIALYRDLLARHSRNLAALNNLAALLAEAGETAEAEAAFRQVLREDRRNPRAFPNLCQILMGRGAAAEVASLSRDLLAAKPGDSFAIAYLALALRESGDLASARRLERRELVSEERIEAPEGYSDLAAFNEALAAAVLARADLVANPEDRTTRKGRQSGALFPATAGPLAELERIVRAAFEARRLALPREADHPYLAQRPRALKLHGWATLLGHQGHQMSHLHPSGWSSGVYYVRLPAVMQREEDSQAGWIEFGDPSSAFHATAEPDRLRFQPVEGKLVLFPSYFHHRTIPFEAEDLRISIAFDALPA